MYVILGFVIGISVLGVFQKYVKADGIHKLPEGYVEQPLE